MEQFCTLKDGRQICYQVHGEGKPVLLIAGLSFQLITWHEGLIKAINDAGYQAIIFDNRDCGRSTLSEVAPPSKLELLFKKIPARNYQLEDMAADTLELIDHLGHQRIHLVGMSMGGMIAHCFAAAYPERVQSLISVFSTTGSAKIGQPNWRVKLHMLKPTKGTREDYVEKAKALMKIIEGSKFATDFDWYADIMARQWDRQGGKMSDSDLRQVGAIMKSGDRTRDMAKITAPTLVIHGSDDAIVDPSGGEATAAAIKGAEFKLIDGMGHALPETLLPVIMPSIIAHMDANN